ncbi:hypothetical protein M5K25_013136 [Dendrobium thyrsiflorum]|uniref:Uncharacterized protein n=1 Tax=Dendrobium thyrsiflorum TaxID=117978 RepID=A0ABD0UYW1_DENTH
MLLQRERQWRSVVGRAGGDVMLSRGQVKACYSQVCLRTQVFPVRVTYELKYFLSNLYQSESWDRCGADFLRFQRQIFIRKEGTLADFWIKIKKNFMAAKKVDALEERFEGEMSQIKATVEDRISSVENKVSDLHTMMKKLLENQIAALEAKESVGKTTSSVYRRRDDEVEIMEEQKDMKARVWGARLKGCWLGKKRKGIREKGG